MESPVTSRREELGRCIRSLTSVLYKFNMQKSTSTWRKEPEIPGFLRHFNTLLTYGDDDRETIAVAGSIAPQQRVRAVVVSQNPCSMSPMQKIRLTVVNKDDLTARAQESDFVHHVKDVLRVLSTFNPQASLTPQIRSFELFFLSRSFRKFDVRFKQDVTFFGGKRLYEKIREWKPDPNRQELRPTWVNPPNWLLEFSQPFKINSRNVEGHSQLEFSDETKRAWSMILFTLLAGVDDGIKDVKTAKAQPLKGRKETEELQAAINKLNYTVGYLYSFVHWRADVVKSLLTKTSMVSSIPTEFMPTDSEDSDWTNDDLADLDQELQETKAKGEEVFRYLRMATAWHAAINDFCSNPMFPELLKNLEVGLVEVPPSPTSVLSPEEICNEFFSRFPDMLENHRQTILELIQSRHPGDFSGCIHAEATLMGLLSYYRPGMEPTSYTRDVVFEDLAMLQHIAQPVAEAANPVIAVSQKCCWCCSWLGKNLDADFILPGTHGIMFPWDPPKVGVNASVLEKLEQELWQALHDVVFNFVDPLHSRQRSSMGSPLVISAVHRAIKPSTFSKMLAGLKAATP